LLARLAILVVQNRISPRRAAVLAYVSSLLLRSLPKIDRENATGRFPAKPSLQATIPNPSESGHTTETLDEMDMPYVSGTLKN
jgi:hypothetical protein